MFISDEGGIKELSSVEEKKQVEELIIAGIVAFN